MADIASLLGRLPGGAPGSGAAPPSGGASPPGGGAMMPAAKPNVGPISQPQAMGGNMAAAILEIHNAVSGLERALPMIPMGSPLHTELLNATKSIIKHLPPGSENPQLQLMAALQAARGQAQQQPMAALNRLFPQPSQAPAGPVADGGTPPAGGGMMSMAA